jgi:hypothetical protein
MDSGYADRHFHASSEHRFAASAHGHRNRSTPYDTTTPEIRNSLREVSFPRAVVADIEDMCTTLDRLGRSCRLLDFPSAPIIPWSSQ